MKENNHKFYMVITYLDDRPDKGFVSCTPFDIKTLKLDSKKNIYSIRFFETDIELINYIETTKTFNNQRYIIGDKISNKQAQKLNPTLYKLFSTFPNSGFIKTTNNTISAILCDDIIIETKEIINGYYNPINNLDI